MITLMEKTYTMKFTRAELQELYEELWSLDYHEVFKGGKFSRLIEIKGLIQASNEKAE